MARIKRIRHDLGLLFPEVATRSVTAQSVPTMSLAMYEEVVALAAEKYDPLLKRVRFEDTVRLPAKLPAVSFVRRRSLEAEVLVVGVDGQRVEFWMTFDFHGPGPDIEALLGEIAKLLPHDTEVEVRNSALVGQVLLPEKPWRISTPHNGEMYFLEREKDAALAFVARHSALSP